MSGPTYASLSGVLVLKGSWKWIAAFIVVTTLSLSLLSLPEPCSAATIGYFNNPVFYPSVEEAYAAIRNMQNQLILWKGSPAQKIELDRFGLRIFGGQELIIFPFDRLTELRLQYWTELKNWGVCGMLKTSDVTMPVLRTPTRELATILYNSIASMAWASGYPLSLMRIGALFRDITPDDLKSKALKGMGLTEPKGMLVQYAFEESPAQAGGLLAGDVIVACNDTPVISYEQWKREIWPTAKGMTFKVLRKGGATSRYVEPTPLEKLPQPPAGLAFAANPASASYPAAGSQKPLKIGFSLRNLHDSEKQASKGRPGAVISAIAPGGLAETVKLQVGDILLECNGTPIPNPEGLAPLLIHGENIFTVLRNGVSLTVTLAPEVSY